DKDGVVDGLDACDSTAAGCKVDARGCPIDSDGDGVCDGLDKCPNTPSIWHVDANGCPTEVHERETELTDTGLIRIQNVVFETAQGELTPEARAQLEIVGAVLADWPQLRIEIGGHTDTAGPAARNRALSEQRVKAVLAFLLERYPQLKPDQ